MKEIIGSNGVTNVSFPNFLTGKNRQIFARKEIKETLNNYQVNIGPNLAASTTESKTTFQSYIRYNGPWLSTINLTDLELEKGFRSFKTNKSSKYDDITADVVKKVSNEKIVIPERIFSISIAKGVFPD